MYSFLLVHFVTIILRISLIIQIQSHQLSDNRASSLSNMATASTNTTRASVSTTVSPPKRGNMAVSTTVSPATELEAYILYSGPSLTAPKNSIPATHGSFVIFWPRRPIPPIMCAVSYTGKTGSHNLAAAWGIAVTLGLVYTNDLPAVRLFTNCMYATKIFDGTNKAGKYKDMWHYILSDLFPKVRAGIINPDVPIINSITSCQKYINDMIRLPDNVLSSLYELDARPTGIFTAPPQSAPQWHQSTNRPPEASTNPTAAALDLPTTSDLDSTCSSSNVSASLLTPRDFDPGTQPSMTQGSLHLQLEATLPTQASIESDLSTTLDSQLSPSPQQARPTEVVTISDGDTAPSPLPPSPEVVDLTTSQPSLQAGDNDLQPTAHPGPNPLDTLVATVNPYMDSTPTDAKEKLSQEMPSFGTPTATDLRFEASIRKAGSLLTDVLMATLPFTH